MGLKLKQEPGKLMVNCDSQSCMKLIKNPALKKRTKHIDAKCHFVKDQVAKGTMEFQCCNANELVADIMTNPANVAKTEFCQKGLGLEE